jgi:hypothetical protein
MPAHDDRQQRFDRTMSDAEALMWNVERDPWLNPSAGTVVIVDQPIDYEHLWARIANAVAKVDRLRERVVPGMGRLSPPTWATDPDLDLSYHLRHLALPAPGAVRQLYDLAATLYQDPYDRTRPLWVLTVVDGLEGGRGALIIKMHHSVTDGIGQVRLSELYMEAQRESPRPPPVDLDQVLAAATLFDERLPAGRPRERGDDPGHPDWNPRQHRPARSAGAAALGGGADGRSGRRRDSAVRRAQRGDVHGCAVRNGGSFRHCQSSRPCLVAERRPRPAWRRRSLDAPQATATCVDPHRRVLSARSASATFQ